jgi:uncharacterized protein with HEPN domain
MSAHALRARDYLAHMLTAVDRIQQYMGGKTIQAFLSDQLLQDGVVRNFEILGEASRKLLESLPDASVKFPGIPFAAIYGMRNQLSHGYFAVDLDVVWKVVERDIPGLKKELEAAIAEFDRPAGSLGPATPTLPA